ncbi:MAG: HAMP domain-containing protein [Alphaproteobacteria bacterium]|nr:HAMP domain-containing protein [Alphaproteobacteria bacterium]
MKLKRLLPLTLFGRALVIMVTPLVIVQVVTAWVFYDRHWETVSRRLANALAGDVAILVEMHEREDGEGGPTDDEISVAALRYFELQVSFDTAVGFDANAAAAAASAEDTLLTAALAERVRRPFIVDTETRPRDVEIQVQLTDGIMTVLAPRKRLYTSTTILFLLWMIGTSIVTLIIATHFLRRQIRPILKLAHAADSFGRGIDVPEFRPEGAAEVRQAAHAFLLMKERLSRQISQRTEMLAGVSHDLRTPLTRMRLELAMLGDTPDARGIGDDIAEMEHMIEGYLAFARGEGSETPTPTGLGNLVAEVVDGARRSAQGVTITLDAGPDEAALTVPVRPNAFKRCLANLVGNACRHGRNVVVTARRLADSIEILVDDDGPGIPVASREEVFRPFFRLDRSRNPKTGGTGLGLTIARDVARGHGGDVVLEAAPTGGLRARVTVPV